jgi:hypothetical protein
MKQLAIVLGFVSLFAISCKKTVSESGQICFTRTLTELKIENNSGKQIYFIAFGQNILPLIDWAPICNNNYIIAHGSINIPVTQIDGYMSNDPVVVYWWKCVDNNPVQIRDVELDNNQSVCK